MDTDGTSFIDFSAQYNDDDTTRRSAFATQQKANRVVQDEITAFGIPDQIAQRAADIYKRISNGKTHREAPRHRLEVYCTYCAMTEMGHCVDPALLGRRMGGLSIGEVRKAFTRFSTHKAYRIPIVIHTPDQFVRDYAEQSGVLDEYHIQRAVTVAQHLVKTKPALTGEDVSPTKAAAVLVCMYCERNGIPLDEKAFAEALCMTPASVQATKKQMGHS